MPSSCNALKSAGTFQLRLLLQQLTIRIRISSDSDSDIGSGSAMDTATAMPCQLGPGISDMALQVLAIRLRMGQDVLISGAQH